MARKTITLAPELEQILKGLGARIRKARLRRNISVKALADKSGISEYTLSAIEKGVATVSIGAYAAVLNSLGLDKDIDLLAQDKEEKKRFWEHNLKQRERASKRK